MSVKSSENTTNTPLLQNRSFIGGWDSVINYQSATITCSSPTDCQLIVTQSQDKMVLVQASYPITHGTNFSISIPLLYPYFKTALVNNGITQTFLNFETIYRPTNPYVIPQFDSALLTGNALNVDVKNTSIATTCSTPFALDTTLQNSNVFLQKISNQNLNVVGYLAGDSVSNVSIVNNQESSVGALYQTSKIVTTFMFYADDKCDAVILYSPDADRWFDSNTTLSVGNGGGYATADIPTGVGFVKARFETTNTSVNVCLAVNMTA